MTLDQAINISEMVALGAGLAWFIVKQRAMAIKLESDLRDDHLRELIGGLREDLAGIRVELRGINDRMAESERRQESFITREQCERHRAQCQAF